MISGIHSTGLAHDPDHAIWEWVDKAMNSFSVPYTQPMTLAQIAQEKHVLLEDLIDLNPHIAEADPSTEILEPGT